MPLEERKEQRALTAALRLSSVRREFGRSNQLVAPITPTPSQLAGACMPVTTELYYPDRPLRILDLTDPSLALLPHLSQSP